MSANETCPHCGADADDASMYLCGTEEVLVGVLVRASGCYERQLAAKTAEIEQLFTDPENQPTQYGTVTLKYMEKEIIKEREACAKLAELLQKMQQQESLRPEPFGYFQYDIRLDAWVQNRTNNKGVAFYIVYKNERR
jgi:hypothetical protein